MGVYQSVTAPEIRRRQVKQVVTQYYLDEAGKKAVASRLRKEFNIPRKVIPTLSLALLGGVEFLFSWYEVETFN